MKLFLSWSKEPSKAIAQELRHVIPMILPQVSPWMSDIDIQKGGRWSAEIAAQLDQTDTGLVIVTPSNMTEPWLFFEAGALSKSVDEGKVHPIAVGVDFKCLLGPLGQFQATHFEREDFLKLLLTLNRESDQPVAEWDVQGRFNRLWPGLELHVKTVLAGLIAPKADEPSIPPESDTEPVSEINTDHISILKYLVHTSGWQNGPTVAGVASNAGMHVERAKLRLDELKEGEFITARFRSGSGYHYALAKKGRVYAADMGWI